ncbi:hypothetical protein Q6D67_20370 [Haliea sp. E1-2-M8]|uniref:hypothetical protein n=1 Tax=Haliea sp. E1-2-M8 TaxID=3064706 RepID=UPI0027288449|nr:hypothetical protein [Haliea sp. E1-2-M8]MDO8864046.1 hypothetical protein [Haliea sp. E1-2-M8]
MTTNENAPDSVELSKGAKVRQPHKHYSTGRGRGKAAQTLAMIDAAHDILLEIEPASVRAVCYRLFVHGHIKGMHKNETQKVSRNLVYAREQGIIPWDWIVDETREPERVSTWRDPEHIIRAAVNTYRRDYWQDQPQRVEVWSEKGTIRGTLAPVLNEYGVTFRVMHGYTSATSIQSAALESLSSNKPLTILYVGDWDPSGLHMSEVDLPSRLARYGGDADIIRIALDEDDVTYGELPSFEAETKKGDTRYPWFTSRYGRKCWELDALPPPDLRERVENNIIERLDRGLWDRAVEVEQAETESMREIMGTLNSILRPDSKYSGGDA